MAKAPAFQFYVKDWLCDPELRLASVTSRGAWIDILCFMWENSKRGEITATPLKFARLISGTLDEALHFLNELYEHEFGDMIIPENITFPLTEENCNTTVTIINRRMHSEFKDRQNTRLRVKKHREKQPVTPKKQKCNVNVTLTSPSPSPSPILELPKGNSSAKTFLPPCPHQKIIDLYHEKLPVLAKVKVWDKTSKAHLKSRWRENPEYQCMEFWKALFEYVSKSDFLTGRVKDWQADLSWIVLPSNFAKILNGRYHKNSNNTKLKPTTYSQAKDAEGREMARWVKRRQDEKRDLRTTCKAPPELP